MKGIAGLKALGLVWALAVAAAAANNGAGRVPELSLPVSAPALGTFPLKTGEQFFAGATKIVDLGGEPMSHWTRDLAARAPGADIHMINVKPNNERVEEVRQLMNAPRLQLAQYNFFKPPEGHPTGDRVVLNSPNFGGIFIPEQADGVAEMIDRHLEPGGLFYAYADDLFFMALDEMAMIVRRDAMFHEMLDGGTPLPQNYHYASLQDILKGREQDVYDALGKRFGRENVSRQRLSGYHRGFLNAGEKHTYQVRKPK